MLDHEARFTISAMCGMLKVSRSGYHAWRVRPASKHEQTDAELGDSLRELFEANRGKYGSPRLGQLLRRQGRAHSSKRIARVMAESGLFARKKRRRTGTTKANPTHVKAPNLLNREFTAEQPNRKWVSDIKQIETGEGFLYLAATVDLYSRMAVGWAMDERMEASLTRRAFQMAVNRRGSFAGALHHSDQGSQFSDAGFRQDLIRNGTTQSMSRKGNVWDNAAMESFFATLTKELLQDHRFATREQAKMEVFKWIETDYNRTRLHSTLGYLSPLEFEASTGRSS